MRVRFRRARRCGDSTRGYGRCVGSDQLINVLHDCRVPAVLRGTERENALLGAALFLVATCAAERGIEAVEIERLLDVKLRYRGNRLEIAGPAESRALAERAITSLYRRLKEGRDVAPSDVQAAVRMAAVGDLPETPSGVIQTRRRRIKPLGSGTQPRWPARPVRNTTA